MALFLSDLDSESIEKKYDIYYKKNYFGSDVLFFESYFVICNVFLKHLGIGCNTHLNNENIWKMMVISGRKSVRAANRCFCHYKPGELEENFVLIRNLQNQTQKLIDIKSLQLAYKQWLENNFF